jgi:UDP-2,3-diacylglucosamine pyrophosphatase LpxH
MNERKVNLIVSDLHVSGGPADRGDDHVYDKSQFVNFVKGQAETPAGLAGEIELIINGDFLEFAQVEPDVYTLGSSKYWCSEDESRRKLRAILDGHPEIFEALRDFQQPRGDAPRGNQVTIAAGNHDVDLVWKGVQEDLREKAGQVNFQLGDTWYWRHGGRLQVGHGHMYDPANAFGHWSNPILDAPDGPRLEMCPGTLFMVKFVNWLEKDYPFSDNIKPVTGLAGILWREKKGGLFSAGWMLARFLARHPNVSLGTDATDKEVGARLVQMLEFNDVFAEGVTRLYRKVRNPSAEVEEVQAALSNEAAFFEFLYEMMPRLSPEEWSPVLAQAGGSGTLGIGGGAAGHGDAVMLGVAEAAVKSDMEILRKKAEKEIERDGGPQVVVMGHTHQPDTLVTDRGSYFNPGSWTRYAELARMPTLTLEALRHEEDFPYQLNYVRVEDTGGERLRAEMITYEELKP